MAPSPSTRPGNNAENSCATTSRDADSAPKPLRTKMNAPLLKVAAIPSASAPSTRSRSSVEAVVATSASTCTAEETKGTNGKKSATTDIPMVNGNTSAPPDSKGKSADGKKSAPRKKQIFTINEKISKYHEVRALVDARSQDVSVASILKKAGISKKSYDLWGKMVSRYEEAVAKNPKVGTLTRFNDPTKKAMGNSKSKSKSNPASKSKPKTVYPPYCGIAVAAENAPLAQKRQPGEPGSKDSRQNAKRGCAGSGKSVDKEGGTSVETGAVAEEEEMKPKSTAEFETTLQKMQAEIDRLWEENDRLKQTLKKRKREDEASEELRTENKRLRTEINELQKESSGFWGGCAIS
mmetsp:Transcript_6976/g.16091  ORF Transcript_6976/g.16091 Transcript_6976/m.16091 type:complete len:351 (-) Transcript_6976:1166-2218(-)